jgi:hypothetical protein
MSFTYRLNRTGEMIPPGATPARMLRIVDVAERKDASYVRLFRYDEMVFTRYEGKLRMVRLYRRPLTQTVSMALATFKENFACWALLVEASRNSFHEAGEL